MMAGIYIPEERPSSWIRMAAFFQFFDARKKEWTI